MVDFINEVEEELRKDKYNELLRKYGAYLLAIIVAIVAYAGYIEYRKYAKGKVARSASASFVAADKLEQSGDLNAASDKFVALSEVAPSGYAGSSLVRAAGIKVQIGDYEGAVSLFDKAADAFKVPLHKDLASLKAAMILLELGRLDDVINRTTALETSDSAFSALASEINAYALLRSDDFEGAETKFTFLANAPGVPQGIKARAEQNLALMKAKETVENNVPTLDDITAPLPISRETVSQKDEPGAVAPIEENK